LSLVRSDNHQTLLEEIDRLEKMTEYIERHLVLCDERDCRECGRQNRIHVELPGANFTNILRAGFMNVGSESVKRHC